jgi:predicted SprT family Zn-dependent metalloprotease
MNLNDARKLAKNLIKEFGLSDWKIKFDRAFRRFGQCQFKNKTISLSRHLVLLNDKTHVEDVIRHEIAHALLGSHYRPWHGKKWKEMAVNCGAKPERCYDSTIVKGVKHYWIGTCPGCGVQTKRYRRTRIACRKCCNGKFNVEFLFIWKRLEEEA